MIDKVQLRCECCGQVAVGVCSTIVPYSAAFCRACLENHAQPAWIMEFVYEEQLGKDLSNAADWLGDITVFVEGKYVPFREYIEDKYAPT